MPLEGGLYQWAKLGFNELTGFFVAWNLWLFAAKLSALILVANAIGAAICLGEAGRARRAGGAG